MIYKLLEEVASNSTITLSDSLSYDSLSIDSLSTIDVIAKEIYQREGKRP